PTPHARRPPAPARRRTRRRRPLPTRPGIRGPAHGATALAPPAPPRQPRAQPPLAPRLTAPAGDEVAEGAADDAGVEREALMAQIEELVLQLLEGIGFCTGVAVLDLGPASEARADAVAKVVEGDLAGQFPYV